MAEQHYSSTTAAASPRGIEATEVTINKVLRNTYTLLAMTVAFSAIMAATAMYFQVPFMGLWMLAPHFLFCWLVSKNANNSMGLVWTFALTGWLGFTLGPILNAYVAMSGYGPILLALGGTAGIFFMTSAYVLITRKDLSFMGGFLMVGLGVAFIASIANVFLGIQGMSLAISCIALVVCSGLIMWQTSRIIHGGETNYITATVTIFVMLYNVFTSLLHLIGMGGDD